MKTRIPEETIRGRNLCCLSKQIKFQRCNKTEVCLKAIAGATTDTLPSGFLIKATTAIIIWQIAVGLHTIRVIMFLCSRTAVHRKSIHVIIFKCSFYVGGRWSKGWEQLKVKVSRRRLCLCGFYLPEKKRLSSGPLWSNLLRQHINYAARLGCHLLQTGQILIERCRYKKHLWFVSFLWNVTHTEWEEMLWIIINSHSVQHTGLSVRLICDWAGNSTHTKITHRVCKIWNSHRHTPTVFDQSIDILVQQRHLPVNLGFFSVWRKFSSSSLPQLSD